jgi:tRNA(Ile)-lysidine synthase
LVWKNDWPTIQNARSISISENEFVLDENWILKLSVISREDIGDEYFNNTDPMTAYLDRSNLTDEIRIRFWQLGDVYHPLGMGGRSIKLSDIWINHKIPKRAKEKWPVVEAGGEIIWIPGFQPSHRFRITESTNDVLFLRVRKNT